MIGRQTGVVSGRKFDPVVAGNRDSRNHQAGTGAAVRIDHQPRHRDQREAQHFELGAVEANAVLALIVDHSVGDDAPARLTVAAFGRGDGAAAVGRVSQRDFALIVTFPLPRGQPPAFGKGQQHVLHGAGFQLVRQLHAIGVELVAVGIG